jgi:hypothetical protein
MTPKLWALFGKRSGKKRGSDRLRSRCCRPALEALEDRLSPAVLIVNSAADNTTDTIVLTLRDALTLVNSGGNPASLGQASVPSGWASQISGIFGNNDIIDFNIGGGTQSIVLTSNLPAITSNVKVDGTSQPGYAGQPLIVINVSNIPNSIAGNGLEIDASAVATIQGLEIEGASHTGILLQGGGANIVVSNWLIGNALGLLVDGSDNNTIGAAGAGNMMSGNVGNGITIEPDQTSGIGGTGNLVRGNWIGTDASGPNADGNGGNGVDLTASGNTIGGQATGDANVIAFNRNDGVLVHAGMLQMQASPAQDLISANSIFDNFLLGIDLNGGNNNQPAPAVISASVSGGQVQVQGTLTAAASTQYTLEFFGNPFADAEGKDFLGSTTVTTDSSGKAAFTFNAPIPATNHGVAATATDPSNNTSEFSAVQSGTAVLTVNSAADNTTDTTVLTLRDALRLVNNGGNPASLGQVSMPSGWASQISGVFGNNDIIDFNIGGGGTQAIVLTSDLPAITNFKVTIDGTSQPGYAGQPLIVINANNVAQNGLWILAQPNLGDPGSDGTIVEGLQIEGATIAGIHLSPNSQGAATPLGGENTITRNWLVDNAVGLLVDGSNNNTIGGTAAGAGNLVAGNHGFGIVMEGNNSAAGGMGNLVEGNFIGTDASGAGANGNGGGVELNASSNTIGGTTPPSASGGAGNLISGNHGVGIIVNGASAPAPRPGNLIEGNYIGTQLDGQHVLPNGNGIDLEHPFQTIGGTAAGAGNLISGNLGSGVIASAVCIIEGNFIGTDRTGTTIYAANGAVMGNQQNGVDLDGVGATLGGTASGAGNVIAGNSRDGILIQGGLALVEGNLIGTDAAGDPLGNAGNGIDVRVSGNTIGGQAGGAANVIAFNGNDGVLVDGALPLGATENLVSANSIFSNANLGIELKNDGNNIQPAPAITSASISGGQAQVQGALTAAASTQYTLEFFGNPIPSTSSVSEGKDFLGSIAVATDTSGKASFTFNAPMPATDQIVTATATDPNNNTSEFSSLQTASTSTTISSAPNPSTYGQLATLSATVSNSSDFGGTPSGSVQFEVDGSDYGSPVALDSAGQASTTDSALAAGSHAIVAVYNPTGTFAGSSAASVKTVTPAPLIITADNQSMVYGGPIPALTVTYAGLVNGDTPATFSVSPNLAPVASTNATSSSDVVAGGYPINVDSAADANYTITYFNGTLTITPANQAINWTDPADIVYGTALSGVQLNATVSAVGPAAPGALGYTPAAGTILSAGNGQFLTVTAAATTDYNTATKSVTINVLKASPSITAVATPSSGLLGNVTLNASATLTGGHHETGSIIFSLYAPGVPSTGTPVFTTTAVVSADEIYSPATGYIPTVAGTYNWVASYSGDSNTNAVSTALGSVPVNVTMFSLRGSAFDDLSENGFSNDDPKLGSSDAYYVSVTVNLIRNGGSTPYATTSTDASGNYSFVGLPAGTYSVNEAVPSGWKETANRGAGSSGPSSSAAVAATSGGSSTGNDFDNFKYGQILGNLFHDLTGNGFSADDPALTGMLQAVTLKLFKNGSATPFATTTQDSSGGYRFTGLDYGTYSVQETVSTSWVQTAARGAALTGTITAVSGLSSAGNDFDNAHIGAKGSPQSRGYWQNKNGNPTITANDIAVLNTLNLRDAKGNIVTFSTTSLPTAQSQVASFLSPATTTNPANGLSAQLVAMELNVLHDFVDARAVIYEPALAAYSNALNSSTVGGPGALYSGSFITISNLINAVKNELGLYGNPTKSTTQNGVLVSNFENELTNALNSANSNQNFVI